MSDVWLQLAEMYNRRGMTAEAVAAFKEIVKRNPTDAAGLIGAASGLLQMRKRDEARAHAELVTATAPAAAYELLARIAIVSNDPVAAREAARRAHQADLLTEYLELLRELGVDTVPSYGEALERYRQAALWGLVIGWLICPPDNYGEPITREAIRRTVEAVQDLDTLAAIERSPW